MYSLKDILFEQLAHYKYFRPYNHNEIEYEIDEYFKNEYTKKKLPKMWKDRDDGRSDIKTAPYEFFDEEELRSISNTDVGEILDSENKMERAIELAKEYGKNYKNSSRSETVKEIKTFNLLYHIIDYFSMLSK